MLFLKTFFLCKITYIFKVPCIADFFSEFEEFCEYFFVFCLVVKNVLVPWKITYETVSYVDDIAREGQGLIYVSSRIE